MMIEVLYGYGVPVIACALVAINFYGLVICKRFIDRLKAQHRDAWLGMGSPKLINAENAFEANRLFLFIVLGRFASQRDSKLSRDGFVMQGIILVSAVGLIALFVLLRQSAG